MLVGGCSSELSSHKTFRGGTRIPATLYVEVSPPPLSSRAYPDFLLNGSPRAPYVDLPKENHKQLTGATPLDRKSGEAEGSAVLRTPPGNVLARYRDRQLHHNGLVKFCLEFLSAGEELAVYMTRRQLEYQRRRGIGI